MGQSVERRPPAIRSQSCSQVDTSKDGWILQAAVLSSPPHHLSFLNFPLSPCSPFQGQTDYRSEGVSERQFSPDPFINFGYIAFMAAMGLDLVYKITRSLSYF